MSPWDKWRNPRSPRRTAWGDLPPSPSRRAFLGGAAAAVTLPFLPSLLPAGAARADASGPLRVVWWYSPNGFHPESFHPTTTGTGYTLTRALEPLAAYRDRMLVLSGLDNLVGEAVVPGDHVRGLAGSLTGMPITRTTGGALQNGVSVDQRVAQAWAGQTPFPSLELSLTEPLAGDSCDSGYACAYRNVSWSSPSTPVARLSQPAAIFNRLFGGLGLDEDPAARAERLAREGSVLDLVIDDVARLQPRLSRSDRARLDQHLTGLRELERRIDDTTTPGACTLPDVPPRERLPYEDSIPIVHDLLAHALACDLSRVASLMLEHGGDEEFVPFLGFQEGSHQVSHYGSDPTKVAKYDAVSRWRVGQLADFLDRLDAMPEGTGSVLDHTLVVLFSDVNDGNAHTHRDLPIALLGGANGLLDGGRHLRFGGRPVADLHHAILELTGVSVATWGRDGTGPLPGVFRS